VDDAPHTTCTPSSIPGVSASAVIVPLKRPGWLPPEVPVTSEPFNAAAYRRKTHNPTGKRLKVR
jgi:hypothetical protein